MTLDCQACGACCYGAAEYVAVTETDRCRMSAAVKARHVVRRKGRVWLRMVGDRCAALSARQGHYACRIYEMRPKVCKVVEAGSRECLEARRRRGLD